MEVLLIAVAIVVCFIAIICIKESIMKKYIIHLFGQKKSRNGYDFSREYYEYLDKKHIDDITYNDLELEEVFKKMDKTYTGIGMEYMFAQLFTKDTSHEGLEHILKAYKEEKVRNTCIYELYKLGRRYSGILDICQDLKKIPIYILGIICILSACLVASIIATVINFENVGYVIFLIIVNNILSISFGGKFNHIADQIMTVNKMVGSLHVLMKNMIFNEKESIEVQTILRILKRKFFLASVYSWISKIDILYLFELVKAIFFTDFFQAFYLRKEIFELEQEIVKMYEYIGKSDMALSIYCIREQYQTCIPKVIEDKKIEFINGYHPMLKTPVVNSFCLDENCIITGSNASGKSTFLKTIGINIIFARAFNTCFGEEFSYYPYEIISSIHMKDDLLSGDSYYVKEIKVLKRIVDVATEDNYLILIDEILRGTNERERVLIAKAIIRYLFNTKSMTLLTTHDLAIVKDFIEDCKLQCFNDTVKENEIVYDYKIHDGICTVGNAISLLNIIGFNQSVIDDIAHTK